jgi:hypothetical protein
MATTLDYLKQAYQQRKSALDVGFADTQRLAQDQIKQTETEASGLAQEAWVGKKQQERTLPNVMAQAGLGGQGYTETTANAIGTAYQNAWNDIQGNKQKAVSGINSNLMSAQSQHQQNEMNTDADWANQQASYYESLRAKVSSAGGSASKTSKEGSSTVMTQLLDGLTTGQEQQFDSPLEATKNWVSLTSGINTYLDSLVTDKTITQAQSDALWKQVIKYWEAKKYKGRDIGKPVASTPTTATRPLNKAGAGQKDL